MYKLRHLWLMIPKKRLHMPRNLLHCLKNMVYPSVFFFHLFHDLLLFFLTVGVGRNRVCIKIPATPESMLACQYLHKIGIQTLATCLFSLPQALAASQAGCKYVAPYFNGEFKCGITNLGRS